MAVEKKNKFEENKFKKGNLKFAVVGHIEWINFLRVDKLPEQGIISHSKKSIEYPAGGGSIIAKILSDLTLNQIHFSKIFLLIIVFKSLWLLKRIIKLKTINLKKEI